jgi:hypothetical protein
MPLGKILQAVFHSDGLAHLIKRIPFFLRGVGGSFAGCLVGGLSNGLHLSNRRLLKIKSDNNAAPGPVRLDMRWSERRKAFPSINNPKVRFLGRGNAFFVRQQSFRAMNHFKGRPMEKVKIIFSPLVIILRPNTVAVLQGVIRPSHVLVVPFLR